MRALSRRNGGVSLGRVPVPQCGKADDVRVRVRAAGLCRTDLYVASGRIAVREPRILGHEFAGIVSEVGSSMGFETGDTVTVIPLIPCGNCPACAQGRACARPDFLGVDRDGAFADEIVVPAGCVRKFPPRISFRHAAYTEPVAAALAVLNAPLPRDGLGIVLGESRVAMLTERILLNAGFRNVHRAPISSAADLAAKVDFAIETEASEQGLRAMLEVLKPNGIAVLKSRPFASIPFDLALAVRKEITLHAVHYGSFERAVELIVDDELGISDFLGTSFAIDDHPAAFASAEDGASTKVFFEME